jgi:hypothetical protein
MVEDLSLASLRLMRLGQQGHRLPASVAALLAATHTAVRGFERSFGFAIQARGEDAHAIGERSEGIYSQVYACLLASEH